MNAILICPADRPNVAFLSRSQPLALVPILGRSLLDLWIADLAAQGAGRVLVLAADRPDLIRRFVGRGERWGIQVEVVPVQRELSADEALARHTAPGTTFSAPFQVVTLDRLPHDGPPLWNNISAWFAAVRASIESAAIDRVGTRQPSPGIFVHARTRLSPGALLHPPCWIGADSWIGPRAIVGPNSVVEAHSYIDEGAEVVDSLIGPGTYVGALTEIRDSIAWGRNLYKIPTGSATQVFDGLLLGPVHAGARQGRAGSLFARALALVTLILSSPLLAIAWLRRPANAPLFVRLTAVRTPTSDPEHAGTVTYHRLNGFHGLLSRWPEIWKVVQGQFRWVGNRPLTPSQAESLASEYERLWLGVSTGIVSLADAEGCSDPYGDEARAHSSFFSVRPDWRHRMAILGRTFLRQPPSRTASSPRAS